MPGEACQQAALLVPGDSHGVCSSTEAARDPLLVSVGLGLDKLIPARTLVRSGAALVEWRGAQRSAVSKPSGPQCDRILGFDMPFGLLNQRMLLRRIQAKRPIPVPGIDLFAHDQRRDAMRR